MDIGELAFDPLDEWKPVNPKKTALVIIDMQYATGSRNAGVGKIWKKQDRSDLIEYRYGRIEKLVVPNIQKLLRFFRENSLKLLYVTYGSEVEDYSDLPPLVKRIARPTNNRRGCKEHEIIEEVRPLKREVVLNKITANAFDSTCIDTVLRGWGIDFLVFTGVSTHACVDSTARAAADRGYKVVLLDDATAGASDALHKAAIQNFGAIFGRVETTDNIINEMRSQLIV
jgi:nicotinamidase-related amidase